MKQTLIGIGIIIALAGASFFFIHRPQLWEGQKSVGTEQTQRQVYQSTAYTFSFEVPQGFTFNEYTSDMIAVGTSTDGGFDSDVDVVVAKSYGEGGYQSFNAFLFENGRNACAADGPTGTIYCTELVDQKPFETTSGRAGTTFYMTRVYEDFATGEKREELFGPFFAFDIHENTPDSTFSALVVRAPANLSSDEVRAELVEEVAKSVQIGDSSN